MTLRTHARKRRKQAYEEALNWRHVEEIALLLGELLMFHRDRSQSGGLRWSKEKHADIVVRIDKALNP